MNTNTNTNGTTLVVGHHPRISPLDILRIITALVITDAPILLQTFHSPNVALAVEGTALGLGTAESILDQIQALHTATPAPQAPQIKAPASQAAIVVEWPTQQQLAPAGAPEDPSEAVPLPLIIINTDTGTADPAHLPLKS